MAQDRPKMAQDGLKMAQDRSKMFQDRPEMAQDKPNMAQDRPKMARHRFNTGARCPKTGSRWPQNLKNTKSVSMFLGFRPFKRVSRAKTAPRQPKTAQNRPKTGPRCPKTGPRQGPDMFKAANNQHSVVLFPVSSPQLQPTIHHVLDQFWFRLCPVQDVPRQVQAGAKTGPRQPTTSSPWSLYQPPVHSSQPPVTSHHPARPGSRSE